MWIDWFNVGKNIYFFVYLFTTFTSMLVMFNFWIEKKFKKLGNVSKYSIFFELLFRSWQYYNVMLIIIITLYWRIKFNCFFKTGFIKINAFQINCIYIFVCILHCTFKIIQYYYNTFINI